MSYAGAGAKRNTRNAILWKMKKRQKEIAHPVAEKPEAVHKLSSAYHITESYKPKKQLKESSFAQGNLILPFLAHFATAVKLTLRLTI